MSSVCIDMPVAIPSRTPSLSQHTGSFALSPRESPRTSQSVALTLSLSALDLAASNSGDTPFFQFTPISAASPRSSAFTSHLENAMSRPRSMSAVRIHSVQKILTRSGVARRKRFMSEEDSAMGPQGVSLDIHSRGFDEVHNGGRRCAVAADPESSAALSDFTLNDTGRQVSRRVGVIQRNKRQHIKISSPFSRAPGSSIQKPPHRNLPVGVKKGWGWSKTFDGHASPSSVSDLSDTPETYGPATSKLQINETSDFSPVAPEDVDIMITDL